MAPDNTAPPKSMGPAVGKPLKQWVFEEAARLGINARAVYARFYRGRYPGMHLVHVNARVVLVQTDTCPICGKKVIEP